MTIPCVRHGNGRNVNEENWRPLVKRHVSALLLVLGVLSPSARVQQTLPPTIPFESVANPLKLPADINFGEVAGVAVNSKGSLFVFSRGNVSGPSYMATAA